MRNHPNSVEDAVSQIENSFNRGGRYLQNGKPKYTAHAVRMEEETGIKGIAGHYRFINDESPARAEYGYRKRFQKYALAEGMTGSEDPLIREAAALIGKKTATALPEVNTEISKLAELNPELKRLNYDRRSFTESYRALIGITSQYNADDINSYLHSYRTNRRDAFVHRRMDALKKRGFRFGWIPAASTLDKIESFAKHCDRHPAKGFRPIAAVKGTER